MPRPLILVSLGLVFSRGDLASLEQKYCECHRNQNILFSPDIICVRLIAAVHIAVVQPGGEDVHLVADSGLAVRNLQSYCRPKSNFTMR